GLSRTPVREALQKLAGEGLVEVIPRHGARVLPVSPADMREIYQMLTALEPMAAELLAKKRLPPADLKPLTEASRDMATALKGDDLEAWARADERYHRHLIALAGNRLLAEAVQGLWDRAHRARLGWGVPMPEWAPQFEARFGCRLVELYGSTEMGAIIFTPPDGPRRTGSCGKPMGPWEVQLQDEDGFPVPPGTPGELVVR
ncbi:MAG: FCD domain-containing protein, partial [Bryobacterales bacterium]|nr:FCD domain-containing protein [Bryobacterales bacterium]